MRRGAFVGTGVGFVVGFLVAAWLFSSAPGGTAVHEHASPAASPESRLPALPTPGVPGFPAGATAPRAPRSPASSKEPSAAGSAAAESALNARIAELERKLSSAREGAGFVDLTSQSAPLHPPDKIPERFSEAALVDAVRQGLAESGSKAQLSSIDCTEYPCMVYLDNFTRADAEAVRRSSAFAKYGSDKYMQFGISPDMLNGMTILPATDQNPRNAVQERIGYRMGEVVPVQGMAPTSGHAKRALEGLPPKKAPSRTELAGRQSG